MRPEEAEVERSGLVAAPVVVHEIREAERFDDAPRRRRSTLMMSIRRPPARPAVGLEEDGDAGRVDDVGNWRCSREMSSWSTAARPARSSEPWQGRPRRVGSCGIRSSSVSAERARRGRDSNAHDNPLLRSRAGVRSIAAWLSRLLTGHRIRFTRRERRLAHEREPREQHAQNGENPEEDGVSQIGLPAA